MKQVHLLISGFVQGIGYRSWVRSRARSLGLTGWINNLENGSVETVFQGEEEKIKEMIKLCKEGPPMAEVENIEIQWDQINGEFKDFQVR